MRRSRGLRFQPAAESPCSRSAPVTDAQAQLRGGQDWGLLEWAKPILDVVFDGASDAVDYQLRHVLDENRYWRLQVELTRASDDLDDASERNLRELRGHAEQLIAARSATSTPRSPRSS